MQDSKKGLKLIDIIMYGLGVLLLRYVSVFTSEDITQGIVLLLFYITMLIFARYLRHHGGFGWWWSA